MGTLFRLVANRTGTVKVVDMRVIDLNADLGEGGIEDEVLLGLVSSANIACGGHAGDEATMRKSIAIAARAGVAAGAHPGYEDPEHFGRRAIVLSLEQTTDLIHRQVEKLAQMAVEAGICLHHVKPHGALYNQADRDEALAAAIVEGILRVSSHLILYAPPNGRLGAAGENAGLTVWREGFVDRGYRDNGSLMPRGEPGAVLSKVQEAVSQGIDLAVHGKVTTQSGAELHLKVDTLCVHGDGTAAAPTLRALRAALVSEGLTVGGKLGN